MSESKRKESIRKKIDAAKKETDELLSKGGLPLRSIKFNFNQILNFYS